MWRQCAHSGYCARVQLGQNIMGGEETPVSPHPWTPSLPASFCQASWMPLRTSLAPMVHTPPLPHTLLPQQYRI